jgi:hypothetical protein
MMRLSNRSQFLIALSVASGSVMFFRRRSNLIFEQVDRASTVCDDTQNLFAFRSNFT